MDANILKSWRDRQKLKPDLESANKGPPKPSVKSKTTKIVLTSVINTTTVYIPKLVVSEKYYYIKMMEH